MLKELILLVEPHKEEHKELWEYLMLTWNSCHQGSTLKACNIIGMTMMQFHLSNFDAEDYRHYQKYGTKGLES